jgi:hypothetical protein
MSARNHGAEPTTPDWLQAEVSKTRQTVAPPARENCLAAWDANFASGDLPSCSVQSVAVNESIYRGVEESWKKEYWPEFLSGHFVANDATSGFSACRSPATPVLTGRQPPAKPNLSG